MTGIVPLPVSLHQSIEQWRLYVRQRALALHAMLTPVA
jgi:hypothetical protein